MKVLVILSSFVILLTSCAVNTFDIERYRTKFESRQEDFEKLVELLKAQKLQPGYTINENQLPENIQTLLKELEISEVYLNTNQCEGEIEYQFRSKWSTKTTLYFLKNTCDKEGSKKGKHDTVSEMIESWGLGNDWIMMIDHDFM